MAASTSSFLRELTPEIRITIYGHIFGTSQVIKPSSSDTALGIRKDPLHNASFERAPPAEEVKLYTSILATSKTVSLEAIPVLYAEHTIRGTTLDFHFLLQNADFADYARRVEVADCIGHFQTGHFHSVLRRLQILPQVCSLVILSDCLGLVCNKQAFGVSHLTVVEFARMAQLGNVTCTDVGQYQLHGMLGKFKIVNRRISQMWSQVINTPDHYHVWEDLLGVVHKWALQGDAFNRMAWVAQTSLRLWVGLHDLLLRCAISGELVQLQISQTPAAKEMFHELQRYARTTRPFLYHATEVIEGVYDRSTLNRWLLSDLKLKDDHDKLLWATEYLSVNIATYNISTVCRGRRRWQVAESSWAEVDGSLDTIEYHSMHQRNAQCGQRDSLYFRHPTNTFRLLDFGFAYSFLHHHGDLLKGILTSEQLKKYSTLGVNDLKQLTYLCMALTSDNIDYSLEEHEKWASHLLRRYLCASGPWKYHDLLHVPIDDLRRVVKLVLTVLASQKERKRCEIQDHVYLPPPKGFDGEVFYPFAGQYSSLLERAWREYMVTPGAISMDLG